MKQFYQPWFIHDQSWLELNVPSTPIDDRKKYLDPELMRPGRQSEREKPEGFDEKWRVLEDRDRCLKIKRLVLVSDAGLGKTCATHWLHFRINQPVSCCVAADPSAADIPSSQMAFRFEIRELFDLHEISNVATSVDQLFTALAYQWTQKVDDKQFTQEIAKTYLKGYARRGELTLILDGLDHCGDRHVKLMASLIADPRLKRCHLVFAGRTNAVLQYWDLLFAGQDWTFVRVDEFNTAQQVRYLGWTPAGKLRFREINRDARKILATPRVLSYLRERNDFSDIRYASDVYYSAIRYLITEGLRSQNNGKVPQDTDVQKLLTLLGITAWHSINLYMPNATFVRNENQIDPYAKDAFHGQPSRPEAAPPKYQFNIGHEDGDFEKVQQNIRKQFDEIFRKDSFDWYWEILATLNSGFLDQGIFEDQQGGLNQIVWANRSLHEFLLAWYFSKQAVPGEAAMLFDWIYIPYQSASDQYYQFWMFLCEMPSEARDSEVWLRSIEMLYWPNIFDSQFTIGVDDQDQDNPRAPFYAKRSSEMIYRSWRTLDEYCGSSKPNVRDSANKIRDRWWNEFEKRILAGQLGDRYKQTAEDIQSHLMNIPGGDFTMGTALKREFGGFSKWDALKGEFNNWVADPTAVGHYFEQSDRLKAHYSFGVGLLCREAHEPAWRYLASKRWFKSYCALRFGRGGYQRRKLSIAKFALARFPLTNRFLRLFDSSWGMPNRITGYQDYSETENHPCITVSFFDAWVVCQWLRWDGVSCRLPWEDEFEFAAKLGFPHKDRHFPWGDEFDKNSHRDLINCKELGYFETLVADKKRSSKKSILLDQDMKFGLCDLQGNVWQWTQDRYRYAFSEDDGQRDEHRRASQEIDHVFYRCIRSGSFVDDWIDCVASSRIGSLPGIASYSDGFRVARAQ